MTRPKTHDEQKKASIAERGAVVLLCLVPFLATVVYGAVDSWTIGLLSILTAFIAILWLADAWRSGQFRFSSNAMQMPLLGLLALACAQLLPLGADSASSLLATPATHTLSFDPYATRFFIVRVAMCFVFFAAGLVYLNAGSRVRKIAVGLVVSGTLLAFFGILQRLAMPESIYGLRPTPQAIPFGPFVNQHHFAALMEMTSGVTVALIFGSGYSRERKLILGIAAGIMGMAIFFTGSRGGMLSYLAVLAFAAFASLVRRQATGDDHPRGTLRRNLLVAAGAVGLVVLVFGSVLFLGGEASLLRGIGLQESASDPTSGRGHFWNIAWQIFLANPIMGAGFDAYGVAFTRYDTWSGMYRVEHAHNDYLQTLADGGLLGFACVAAFIFLLLRNGIGRITKRSSGVKRSIAVGSLAGCLGILVHSFFDFPLRTPANSFVFLLLVVMAAGTERGSDEDERLA